MEFLKLLALLPLGMFCIFVSLLKWNEIRYRSKGLPPGTMGWPLLGETLEFLKEGPNFMRKQRARYGNVFKTHMLGSPTIISMDPELNRYILLNESKGLVPGYPQSLLDILGKRNIGAVTGTTHKLIRGSAMSLIGPSALKEKLLPKIDKYMRFFLQNWEDKVIDVQQKSQDMAFFISFKQILEDEPSSVYESIKKEFDKLVLGTISLPIFLPGSSYYEGYQARKNVIELLRQVIEQRRASSTTVHNDILHWLLANDEDSSSYKLNDEEIYDQIIMILNSGYETMSTTTMMAIKYLHDHPAALEELREEHSMIRLEKSNDKQPIDWLDYKKMSFTRAVIFETMRLATIVNGMLRKITTKDMKLNGFHIPKGWKIYLYTREINYNPYLYPEPFMFNPWRWVQDKSLESHYYLFLFGGGSRLCPGKELGIFTVSMFLHYFVTWYRWEQMGEHKISQFPRVLAPEGLYVRVTKQKQLGA